MADYSIPSFIIPNEGISINITIPQTQATVIDQGYTYNQAGLTYNEIGVEYGGINNATEDTMASSLSLDAITPHLQGIYDIYTPAPPPPPPAGSKNGPGFLMYVNLS